MVLILGRLVMHQRCQEGRQPSRVIAKELDTSLDYLVQTNQNEQHGNAIDNIQMIDPTLTMFQ